MLVATFTGAPAEPNDTRTAEAFSKFLGAKPYKTGVVAKLYQGNTVSSLTDLLGNVLVKQGSNNYKGFQSIDSDYYEWEIETTQVEHVPFAAIPTGTGVNGSDITMVFPTNAYNLHEIFVIDGSGQQCIVVSKPIRKNDRAWEVVVRLIDDNYSTALDTTACQVGMTTRWLGNAKPELNDCGFTKHQSNAERMRNCLTLIRTDITYSAKYKTMEDSFVKISDTKNGLSDAYYKIEPMEKELLANFMKAREQMLLLAKGNLNDKGVPTISDSGTGRPIPIGDGLIPQAERFCSKHVASKITLQSLQMVISRMVRVAENPTGNHFIFVCNEQFWAIFNREMMSQIANMRIDSPTFVSKVNGKDYRLGATFSSYEFAGNTVSFTVDRTLSREYAMPFALCLDFTGDSNRNNPPVCMYTLKDKDLVINTVNGVGIKSGEASTLVSGGAITAQGYSSIALYNPYRSFMLYSTEQYY